MAIDIDSKLALKSAVDSATVNATLTVTAIDDTSGTVTVVSDTAVASPAATDVLCFAGSMDASGKPILPMGLGGWLPTVAKRTGAAWNTYINKTFEGVNRSVAPSRLAGAFIDGSGDTKKITTLEKLLKKVRRQGSKADMIVLNDEDWADIANEIQSTNTYMSVTNNGNGKNKRSANMGFDALTASFSTSFFDSIVDTPFCPKGRFYVLDTDAIELATYTNAEKINDGVPGNEPGKPDPMSENSSSVDGQPYALNVSDYLSIQPGQDSIDGPSSVVSLALFGGIAVTNPSNCGVGLFSDAVTLE